MTEPITITVRLAPGEVEVIARALAGAIVERLREDDLAAVSMMTVAEFAARARLSVFHAHRLIRDGKLLAHKPGGKGDLRISAASAAKYLQAKGGGNGTDGE